MLKHLRAMKHQLLYGITQCRLANDIGEHCFNPNQSLPDMLNLPTPEGWKTELVGYILWWTAESHPSK